MAGLDLRRGVLVVRRTLSRGEDGLGFNDLKSAAGKRTVALPTAAVASLRRQLLHQKERRLRWGEEWRGDAEGEALLFDRGDGSLLHPNVVTATFQRHVARVGLPRIRFHDLRHTAATLMLAEGVHPKIVSERLGHSSISITLDRYSHVSMDMQREAADLLNAALGG